MNNSRNINTRPSNGNNGGWRSRIAAGRRGSPLTDGRRGRGRVLPRTTRTNDGRPMTNAGLGRGG
jgi:hypothetical protein